MKESSMTRVEPWRLGDLKMVRLNCSLLRNRHSIVHYGIIFLLFSFFCFNDSLYFGSFVAMYFEH